MNPRVITVKTLAGATLHVPMRDDETVADLKRKISDPALSGPAAVPADQMRLVKLVCLGRQLSDAAAISTIAPGTAVHLVVRLSCGDACSSCKYGALFLAGDVKPGPIRGSQLRRLLSEAASFEEQGFARLALLNADCGTFVFELPSPPVFNSTESLFVRIVFSGEFPFKPPLDLTLLTDVPHPCSLSADGVKRPAGRRATVFGAEPSPLKCLFKDEWSPRGVRWLLNAMLELLQWPLDETMLAPDEDRSLYRRSLVRAPFNDLALLRAMRAQANCVSKVSLSELFKAAFLPLPDANGVFFSDSAAQDWFRPRQSARVRARILLRAVALASIFETLPTLVLLMLVRLCGDDGDGDGNSGLVTDWQIDRTIAAERRARARVRRPVLEE
jgi:hypothetical protein